MIDHVELTVPIALFPAMKAFYTAALAPLGYKVQESHGDYLIGFADHEPTAEDVYTTDFWVGGDDERGSSAEPGRGQHFAFRAKDKAGIAAFHDAALEAGGKCNGAPGPRPTYGTGYYAAFVYDPAGNNVEAVIHIPEEKSDDVKDNKDNDSGSTGA